MQENILQNSLNYIILLKANDIVINLGLRPKILIYYHHRTEKYI